MNIPEMSTPELYQVHCQVLDELKRRGEITDGNNPVSSRAERLTCKALGLTPCTASTKGCDATDQNGLRYQIKGRKNGRQLGAIRDLDREPFDVLVFALFNDHLNVVRAVKMPISLVKKCARYQKHTNSWIVIASDSLLNHPDVIDVTAEFRAAAITN